MMKLGTYFLTNERKIELLNLLKETQNNFDNPNWWFYNEVRLIRELEIMVSKSYAQKAVFHAQHYDIFYIKVIIYELKKRIK